MMSKKKNHIMFVRGSVTTGVPWIRSSTGTSSHCSAGRLRKSATVEAISFRKQPMKKAWLRAYGGA